MRLDDKALLSHRKGFDDLEVVLVSKWLELDLGDEFTPLIDSTRYAINFA